MKHVAFVVLLVACKGAESPQVATIDLPAPGDAEAIEAAPLPAENHDAGVTNEVAAVMAFRKRTPHPRRFRCSS